MYDQNMKIKLDIHAVAVKQLESAIWMYAYNYDEVAVHTIAGAAYELYTKRLELNTLIKDLAIYIKQEKVEEFYSLLNMPYNYFKHGEHKYKQLEYLEYDEESVELLIYMSCAANLKGPTEYRINCANTFMFFYFIKHPDLFEDSYRQKILNNLLETTTLSMDDLKDKSALRTWLNIHNHTFIDGNPSPYRDIVAK